MQPRMSDVETRLFECLLRCSDRYLEFGSGGSTCLASDLVRSSVMSIDSCQEWIEKVRRDCERKKTRARARDDPYRYRSYRRLGYAYGRENEREMARLSQATLDSASHVKCRLVPGRRSLPGGMFHADYPTLRIALIYYDTRLRFACALSCDQRSSARDRKCRGTICVSAIGWTHPKPRI